MTRRKHADVALDKNAQRNCTDQHLYVDDNACFKLTRIMLVIIVFVTTRVCVRNTCLLPFIGMKNDNETDSRIINIIRSNCCFP